MLRLVVTYEDRVATVPLRDRPLTIGSAAGNDVVVSCYGVSRRHALLTCRDGEVIIEDLQSKNGLLIRGRRVKRADLPPGTIVQFGRAQLRVEEVSTSDGELALSLENRSSSHGAPAGGTTSLSSAGAPRAALAWARAAEAGQTDRSELLRQARHIANWDAIVVHDDTAILDVDGILPAALPPGDDWLSVPIGGDDTVVAAHGRTDDAWRREFLEYLALKLFAHERGGAGAARDDIAQPFPEGMVPGESPVMRALYDQLRSAAKSDLPILLRGESGTGKELFARLAHAWSPWAAGPFRALNCAAIPAELLEAELFGIRKGVATGVDARPGLFVEAAGGTVFLDEIGDMPPKLQAKLLRVLQEREVQPLGASSPVKIDVRIVASTNRDLEAMVADGAFRGDLYYRLHGIELAIPPLRERREDIAPLVLAFVSRASQHNDKRIRGVTAKALALLSAHDWPGNVRELRHTVEAAVVLARRGAALESSDFAALARNHPPASGALQERIVNTERDAIVEALRRSGGNKTAAARILGITRAGLYLKLKRYGL